MPALAPETQPAVVLWARSGAASLESVPPGCVEPRGQTSMGDGSVEDGRMDGWRMEDGWVDGTPALAAGPGCGARSRDGQERPASQASRDRPRVWVAVGSRAGFPGGPAVSRCFLVPGRRPRPRPAAPAACACRPLPTAAGLSSLSCACDRLCVSPSTPVPRGLGPSWPRLTWVSSPGLCRPVASPGGAVPSEPP